MERENFKINDQNPETPHTQMFVGALIVFDFFHVALISGRALVGSKNLYLGGNQPIRKDGKKIGGGITKSCCKLSKIKAFMYPTNYNAPDSFYNLTLEDITDVLTSADTHL